MGTSRPTWLWWSTGKDAAWALEQLLDDERHHVTGLVTTVDATRGDVPLQGTGPGLLELQAAATGLPLHRIPLPSPCSNADYAEAVQDVAERAHEDEVEVMAFGDLHLADVRAWRDELFEGLGFDTHYPLWGADTADLARRMIEGGLRARVTCVDTRVLDESWLGRPFDLPFLEALPTGVDPCGENGEFHTFVHAGPMLHESFEIETGEVVREGGFAWVEPVVAFPVDGTLDLHGIAPAQVGDLVDDYLDACRDRGILQVRVVHGKGIGALRETVHARLRRRDDVAGFRPGGEGGGGWGATLVDLRPKDDRR